jgi:hypothetical protein
VLQLVRFAALPPLWLALIAGLQIAAASLQIALAAVELRHCDLPLADQALLACDWPLRLAFSVCF